MGFASKAEQRGDDRDVAVGQGQLGTVRLQRRYPEALAAYAQARERFTQLNESGAVAAYWHQTGMAYRAAGQPDATEDAYRQSLAIEVRLGNVAGQASTLGELIMYVLDRPEDAAAFYRQAADKSVEIGDTAGEGRARRISPTLCASSAAWTKRGRKSAGRSNAKRRPATRLSRGGPGPSQHKQ